MCSLLEQLEGCLGPCSCLCLGHDAIEAQARTAVEDAVGIDAVLVDEVQEDEGCRVLMVDAANLPATLTTLDGQHVGYHRLSDVRGYAVLLDETRDCPAYAAVTAK